MFRLNKKIFMLFILFLVVSIITVFEYRNTGKVHTKWGDLYGESGLHALIAYWLLTALFAFFSLKKNKNPDHRKTNLEDKKRF